MKMKKRILAGVVTGSLLIGGTVGATASFPEQIRIHKEQEMDRLAESLPQQEVEYRERHYNEVMTYTNEKKQYITETINEYVEQRIAEKYSFHSKAKVDEATEQAINELKAYVDRLLDEGATK